MKKLESILVIEDNNDHYYLIECILKQITAIEIKRFCDGEEALDFFSSENIKDILPDLILLDLKLPKVNGNEVLLNIKQNNDLKNIPLFILTSSTDKKDIDFCKDLGISEYISKLSMFDTLIKTIRNIFDIEEINI